MMKHNSFVLSREPYIHTEATLLRNVLFLILFVCTSTFLSAQADWAFVRDDLSRPVADSDTLVLSLGTTRLPTEKTFFTHVDEAGVILQVTVTGAVTRSVNGANQTTNESAVFPFAFKAPVLDKNRPLVNMPFQGTPVKGLPLTAPGTIYQNISFDITMIRVDQGNTWTKIANKLISAAQGASIPATPLGTAAKYAVDFASSAMNDALADAGKDQKLSLGSRSLNLRTDRRVSTGTYLLILDSSVKDDGYIDPNNLSQVCLYRQIGAGDTIMVGRTPPAGSGEKPDGDGCLKSSYRPLSNPYVPVILETDRPAGQAVGLSELSLTLERKSKIAHCRMSNKDDQQCKQVFPAFFR